MTFIDIPLVIPLWQRLCSGVLAIIAAVALIYGAAGLVTGNSGVSANWLIVLSITAYLAVWPLAQAAIRGCTFMPVARPRVLLIAAVVTTLLAVLLAQTTVIPGARLWQQLQVAVLAMLSLSCFVEPLPSGGAVKIAMSCVALVAALALVQAVSVIATLL